MRLKSIVAAASVAAALALLTSSGQAQGQGNAPEFVPNEVLVQFRSDVGPGEQARARGLVKGARVELLRRGNPSEGTGDLELMRIAPGLAVADAVRELANDAAVEFSEPNWIYQHFDVPDDPYYRNGSLWGMYGDATSPANQFGSQAGEAWGTGPSCGDVWVGIIDEGYMYAHKDLAANARTNPGEVAGNGVDDDGNGYVDDVHGWDFDGNDSSVFDGTTDDHGTHVAGTIGAVGHNNEGVAGVCWSVKLYNAKFLGRRGGTTANAIKAVDYITNLKTRPDNSMNFVATNNSWGGGGFSKALQDAIARANSADILFIAAAGNSAVNCDTSSSCYPAEYPNDNIIAVASLDSNGALSYFSNYGATTIDIGAPGRGIWSTVPKSSKGSLVSGYASYSGTSMATPHVTGAAALYKARHSSASASVIKNAILNAGVGTSSLNGKVQTGDRLNVSGF